jgi:hypothetical protein
MKIIVSCISCSKEYLEQVVQKLISNSDYPLKEDSKYPEGHPTFLTNLDDEFVFTTTCPDSHENTFVFNNYRFQVLFHLGMVSLQEGYYREAIFNFATAVERFYEFFIEVIMTQHGISYDTFNSTWRHVAAQSERQLGAYIFAYLMHFKTEPMIMKQKQIELRNSVIHKGRLASKIDAEVYGKDVYDYIQGLIIILQQECMNTIVDVSNNYAERLLKNKKNTGNNTTLKSINFCINHIKKYDSLESVKSFDDVLSDYVLDRFYIDKK